MKNIETTKKPGDRTYRRATKSLEINNHEASSGAGEAKDFRRLKWDELVVAGDFVANENLGFEPWEGPSGFRADAFLKPIYRRKRR